VGGGFGSRRAAQNFYSFVREKKSLTQTRKRLADFFSKLVIDRAGEKEKRAERSFFTAWQLYKRQVLCTLGGQGRGRLSSMRARIPKRLTATRQGSRNSAPLPLGEGGGWGKPTAEGELLLIRARIPKESSATPTEGRARCEAPRAREQSDRRDPRRRQRPRRFRKSSDRGREPWCPRRAPDGRTNEGANRGSLRPT
jgi:hypothetical protein